MKRFLMVIIVLVIFILPSCAKTLPEEIKESFEPVQSFKPVTEYSDVPSLYRPILADIYLYGEICRSEIAKPESADSYKTVKEELIQKEYISYQYGAIEGTCGYTLADLDGDNVPELLLVDKSLPEEYKRTQNIYSIFTIRNGQVVFIENNSFEYSLLAEDGMFYENTSSLTVSRLEAGKSEFTTVLKVYNALSFFNSDIPEPYWVKVEDGQQVNITEDEFDMWIEKYKDIKEWILDITLLYDGPIEKSKPTEEPSVMPIEYPQEYQDAPSEYKVLLDELYLLSEQLRLGYPIDARDNIEFVEIPGAELGYAVIDINGDGIQELLLGSVEGLNKASPASIFTLKDGKPVLLGFFWSRYRGVISPDGIIYCIGSSGAGTNDFESFKLEKYADDLTQLTSTHSDVADRQQYFFKVLEGKKHYISEIEYDEISNSYSERLDSSEILKLTVIPIKG